MNLKRFEELRYCGNLPSASGVGLGVLRATARKDLSGDELVALLRFDPALTARLLRLWSSTRAAAAPPVATVEQAAAQVGTAAVRNVALGFVLLPSARAEGRAQFDHDLYWSYSIACALAAEAVAAREDGLDPGEAFTCALLSRIGMLALATIHEDSYELALSDARDGSTQHLVSDELVRFDIQHWEVAAALMAECGLSDAAVGAVLAQGEARASHDPAAAACEALARCLRTADRVARRLLELAEAEPFGRSQLLQLMGPVRPEPVAEERLRALCAEVLPAWRQACERTRLPLDLAGLSGAAEPAAAPRPAALPEPTPEDAVAAPIAPAEMRILLVDDDPRVLRVLRHHLHAAGYQVATAEDGEEALIAARREAPHIVITDWLMPRMSGLDLVRALRRSGTGRDVHILILTARDSDDEVVEAFDAGADDFVAKPCNPRILLARVLAGHRRIELQRQVEADRQRQALQVAEMGLLTRKLSVAAYTDVLTGLPNRRFALERLEREWLDSAQRGRPLSILSIDIDHFKQVNDRYGHDVGDAVLHATAGVLRARARGADHVCRLGGEEFLVINVNSDLHGARMCAERLRDAVGNNPIRARAFEGRVTVSIGLATRVPALGGIDDLLKAADEAVYEAKAAGRNVVVASRRCLPSDG